MSKELWAEFKTRYNHLWRWCLFASAFSSLIQRFVFNFVISCNMVLFFISKELIFSSLSLRTTCLYFIIKYHPFLPKHVISIASGFWYIGLLVIRICDYCTNALYHTSLSFSWAYISFGLSFAPLPSYKLWFKLGNNC